MIESLVYLLIYLIVIGLIYWLAQTALNALPIGEPVKNIARVILLLIVVLVVIYLLLGFLPSYSGRPLFPHRP